MYQELLKSAGHFGLYQKRILAALYLAAFFSSSTIMQASVFVLYTPPHRCYIPSIDGENSTNSELPSIPDDANSSYQNTIELSRFVPIEKGADGTLKWSQCFRFEEPISEITSSAINKTKIFCDEGWKYFAPKGLISATIEYNLVCNNSWLVPLVPSIQMFGVMAGSILAGYVSDRFGRRISILLHWALLVLSFSVLSVLPVWKISYLFWFLMGIAIIARSSTGAILINEVVPSKYKFAVGPLSGVSSAFGFMFIPPLNYFITNWRYSLAVYAGLQAITAIPMYFWTKESMTWLIQNEKHNRVKETLREIAKANKKKDFVFPSNDMKALFDHQSAKKKKLSYIHLVKSSLLRRRLIIFGVAWFATTLTYYGLSINTNNLGGDRYINCFINGAVEIPGYLMCFITTKKLGGRLSYIMTTAISGLCLLITPFLLNETQSTVIVTTCNLIGKLFISGSFVNVYYFTGDLFPTLVRNQAHGATSFIARLAGISVPYLIYLGEMYHDAIPYAVMGSVAVIASMGMLLLPETRNTPMPETMEDAEEQEKSRRGFRICKPRSSDEVKEENSLNGLQKESFPMEK